IIAVTSYALSGEGQKARAAGCDDYVPKPYSPRELLAKIRRTYLNRFAALHESAFDVVDGARSRHRSAIGWFVGDESHEGSRPHANYHDWFGYRQERVSGSRDRQQREGCCSEAAAAQPGAGVLQNVATLP